MQQVVLPDLPVILSTAANIDIILAIYVSRPKFPKKSPSLLSLIVADSCSYSNSKNQGKGGGDIRNPMLDLLRLVFYQLSISVVAPNQRAYILRPSEVWDYQASYDEMERYEAENW